MCCAQGIHTTREAGVIQQTKSTFKCNLVLYFILSLGDFVLFYLFRLLDLLFWSYWISALVEHILLGCLLLLDRRLYNIHSNAIVAIARHPRCSISIELNQHFDCVNSILEWTKNIVWGTFRHSLWLFLLSSILKLKTRICG